MTSDPITEIAIDRAGRLCITPQTATFPLIYRSAVEVYWDESGRYLYSPAPRDWSYLQWFQQIIAAAQAEYGCTLVITPQTCWNNIEATTKGAILASTKVAHA